MTELKIHERIRAARESRGMSRQELSRRAQLPETTLRAYELGHRSIASNLDALNRVCQVLRIDILYALAAPDVGELSSEERELLLRFRQAYPTGRRTLINVAQAVSPQGNES